jgi:hypothetical protein
MAWATDFGNLCRIKGFSFDRIVHVVRMDDNKYPARGAKSNQSLAGKFGRLIWSRFLVSAHTLHTLSGACHGQRHNRPRRSARRVGRPLHRRAVTLQEVPAGIIRTARRTTGPDDMRRALPLRGAPKWPVQAGRDSWPNWAHAARSENYSRENAAIGPHPAHRLLRRLQVRAFLDDRRRPLG